MSSLTEFKLQTKTQEMITYAHTALRQFPKSERHVLSAEIRQCCWRLLRLIIVCNKRYHKKNTFRDLDAEIALLSAMIAMAYELGYLPMKKFAEWSGRVDEIGRMAGGWLKAMP